MNFPEGLLNIFRGNRAVITAAVLIFFATLVVNYLAIPNMLGHDQISNEISIIKHKNPELFSRDYLLSDDSYLNHYNPFFDLMAFLNRFTGGSENTYRLFVPFVFFFFVLGMFIFLYYSGFNFFISIIIAFISSILITAIGDEWGVSGPSQMVARFIVLPFYLPLFLLFYKYSDRKFTPLIFLAIGILGNIHQVSALYVTLILLFSLIFLYGFTKKNLLKVFLSGATALFGILPFAIQHFVVLKPPPLFLQDNDAYNKILGIIHSHLTLPGLIGIYKEYFVRHWYYFWPFFALFLFMIFWRRKKYGLSAIDKTSIAFFIASVIVTFGVSVMNQLSILVFHKKAYLIHEPRALHYIYLVFYLYLAYAFTYIFNYAKMQFQKNKIVAILSGAVFISIIFIFAFINIRHINILLYRKNNYTETGETCRDRLYDWIKTNTFEDSVFIIDPWEYPQFRICTKRALVYTYRDGPLVIRTNHIIEWNERKEIVEKAYDSGDYKNIENAAAKYDADYIINKSCIPFPDLEKVYEDKAKKGDCIYKLNTLNSNKI